MVKAVLVRGTIAKKSGRLRGQRSLCRKLCKFYSYMTCSINYKNTYKKGTHICRQKNYWVYKDSTSSLVWTLKEHPFPTQDSNIKVLKCKFKSVPFCVKHLYCPHYREKPLARSPACALSQQSLLQRTEDTLIKPPFYAAQNKPPKGFPASIAGAPTYSQPLFLPGSFKEPHCRISRLQINVQHPSSIQNG